MATPFVMSCSVCGRVLLDGDEEPDVDGKRVVRVREPWAEINGIYRDIPLSDEEKNSGLRSMRENPVVCVSAPCIEALHSEPWKRKIEA